MNRRLTTVIRKGHTSDRDNEYYAWKYSDGSLRLVRCAYPNCWKPDKTISTKNRANSNHPVLIIDPVTRLPYHYSCYHYHIEPARTGRKVGTGYKNVRGRLFRHRR